MVDETKAGAGPRVTPEIIESRIVGEEFIVMGVLTICVLTLVNGFQVTGESACVDPANFDEELGRSIARGKAVDKIWPLEGYALANRLMFERDAAAQGRIDAMAAEGAGAPPPVGLVVVPSDDLEHAKRLIRQAMDPANDRSRLTEVLSLLTPTGSAVPFAATTPEAFTGLLDRSIDELEAAVGDADTGALLVALSAEYGGKTRKGAVKVLIDELTKRAEAARAEQETADA